MNSYTYNDYDYEYKHYIEMTEHFCNLSRYINEMYPPFIKDLGLYNNEIFLEEYFYIRNKKRIFPYYLELRSRDHGSCHLHIYQKGGSKSFAKIILNKQPTSLQEIIDSTLSEIDGKKITDYTDIRKFLTFLVETWLGSTYKSNKDHDEHSKYAMDHNLTYFEYFQYKWPFILASNPSSNTDNDNNDNKKNKKKR